MTLMLLLGGPLAVQAEAGGAWVAGQNLATPSIPGCRDPSGCWHGGNFPHGLAALSGKLWAVGGITFGPNPPYISEPLESVEVFDTAASNGSWVAGPSMTYGRSYLGVAELGGKVWAVGGGVDPRLATVEVLDPATGSWTAGPSLATARSFHGVAAFDGKLWAVGGTGNARGEETLTSVEMLDPANGSWVAGSSLATGRNGLGLAAFEGRLWAVGGYTEAQGWSCKSVEVLDPATGVWVAGPSLAVGHYGFGLAVLGGQLWAVGGVLDGPKGVVEVLDATAHSARMPTAFSAQCTH
jgi:hypothetical protein